ncbi:hypothetical protein ACTMU2_29190 [Cupriavidus basilensis]
MLREANMTGISEMWKHVNIWFALRNTVAHFGAIDKYEQLDSVSRKEWARLGIEEMRKNRYRHVFDGSKKTCQMDADARNPENNLNARPGKAPAVEDG